MVITLLLGLLLLLLLLLLLFVMVLRFDLLQWVNEVRILVEDAIEE